MGISERRSSTQARAQCAKIGRRHESSAVGARLERDRVTFRTAFMYYCPDRFCELLGFRF